MSQYDNLDQLLMLRCATSPVTFSVLCQNPMVEREANLVAKPDRHGTRYGWRVVDRRLQALRKAGLLTYSRKEGWTTREIQL